MVCLLLTDKLILKTAEKITLSVPLKDKITNTAKQVAQTVKNKVVHIWEVITKRKLKEFIVGKLVKKAMVTQINHITNTVTLRDMDSNNYHSIQGTDISEDVCLGTLIIV